MNVAEKKGIDGFQIQEGTMRDADRILLLQRLCLVFALFTVGYIWIFAQLLHSPLLAMNQCLITVIMLASYRFFQTQRDLVGKILFTGGVIWGIALPAGLMNPQAHMANFGILALATPFIAFEPARWRYRVFGVVCSLPIWFSTWIPRAEFTTVASSVEYLWVFNLASDVTVIGLFILELALMFRIHETQKQSLQESHFELSALYRRNKLLIRSVFHDLANSIQIIDGMSTNVDEDGIIKAIAVCRIKIQVKKQAELINFLRAIETIESGKHVLKAEPIIVSELIDTTLQAFTERALAKGLKIECLLGDVTSLTVLADRTAFDQIIFANVLSNAIKFAPPDTEITISGREVSGFLRLDVTNFGSAIEDQKMEDIFAFDKATTTVGTAGELGNGFGVPLMRTFLTAMGGRFEMRCDLDQSASAARITVSLFLPVAGQMAAVLVA